MRPINTSNVIQGQPHPLPEIQMASLSDLFFNYDHPSLDAFYRSKVTEHDDPAAALMATIDDRDEEQAALLADAKDFADTLDNATGIKLDPEALVADFFSRV